MGIPLLLLPALVLPASSGGVTSKPILPFKAILIEPHVSNVGGGGGGAGGLIGNIIPRSSKLLFLLVVRPWRNELDRRRRMSSTRSEFDRPRHIPGFTVGLSGKDSEFAFVTNGGRPVEFRLLPGPVCCAQKLMFDFLRLLCRSNVFWAENGLGLIK